jgi:hypothetical protein
VPKITDEDLVKVELTMFKSDYDVLRRLYKGNIGVNKVIRTVLRSFVRQINARASANIDEIEAVELALEPESAQ